MDARSILADITVIKDDEFYVLSTQLGKLKTLYGDQFNFCKENSLNIKETGTEEISICDVINKLSLVAGLGK